MSKKHSKRYSALIKGHDKTKELALPEAIKLLKTKSNTKFAESMEAIFFFKYR
jgi:ribosomal protein L1